MFLSGSMEPTMKHPSFGTIILTLLWGETVSGGQFKWGAFLLKSNGEVYKVG